MLRQVRGSLGRQPKQLLRQFDFGRFWEWTARSRREEMRTFKKFI